MPLYFISTRFIRSDFIEPDWPKSESRPRLGWSVTQAAERIGFRRLNVTRIVRSVVLKQTGSSVESKANHSPVA